MGKRFYQRYPDKDRVRFDGGLANKFPKAFIEDNQSPECMNVVFKDGSAETREGITRLTESPVGSFICDGLYTRTDNADGAQTMIAWFGGTAYDWQATTFATIPSAQSIYSASERVFAAEYENYMFFGNGSQTPYKYGGDAEEFTRHGVPAPTETLTAGTAPTGTNLTGEYRYAVTYVNSALVESDISPVTATFTAASEDIRLTSIPVAPQSYGVNQRRLYRTETSGAVYKRLATITDNTTTTYDDAIADAALGVDAPTDQGEPPNYSSVIYHQGRLFCIDPTDNLIKYSEVGNPYVFKATSFLRVGDNTGDLPVGLDIYDNSLVVFCQRNPWIVYMPSTSDTEWSVLRVRANFGSKSPLGSFKYESKVMFPAFQNDKFVGFAALQGQTITPDASILTNTALGSDLQSERIEPDIFDIQESAVSNIVSMVYKNAAYITVQKAAGSTENNRIYVYDFSLGSLTKKNQNSWSPWDNMSANDFTILDGDLYHGSSLADGYVQQMNTGSYNDNGSAINSYFWTKEFSGRPGEENLQKDFRWTNIFFENTGSYNMNFTTRVDSGAGSGFTEQINLSPDGSNWATMRYGFDNWDPGENDGEVKKSLGNFRGKRIQFRFSNQNVADQRFKIYGLNFFYNNKGLR